jgi:hypothetical protein
MSETLCEDCGELFPYDGDTVNICVKCARARIDRYFRGAVA